MRLSPVALLAGAASLINALEGTEKDSANEPTVYNGITVPPLFQLTPENWDAEVAKSKYLLVKHYSPYCPHCIDFAPTYQSVYEFYYTSKPEAADALGTTFTDYYDFRFGVINCIAYYDLCMDHAVKSFPTSIIYENGVVFETLQGAKNSTRLSNIIEHALEKYKPNSRPATIELPDVTNEDAAEKKKEAKAAWKKLEAERKEKEAKEEEEKKAKDEKAAAAKTTSSAAAEKTIDKETVGKTTPEKSLDDLTEKPASSSDSTKSDGVDKAKVPADSSKDAATDSSKVDNTKDTGEKKFGEDWKVPSTGELLKKTKSKEPAEVYNPEGVSVPLTPETFHKLVTSTQDPWFIKFYAPWCSHCKAMAPNWVQMAKAVAGKVNVGEVNCDAESRFCKEMHARAYPTIRFYRGVENAEYRGLRGVGDFVQYAENALEVAGTIPNVDDATLRQMEKEDDVIFIYFYDHASTSEDFKALEQLPLHLIGHAKIVKTDDPEIISRFKITTFPRFLVSREGLPTYYTPITPDEMRNVDRLVEWMKSVWLPLVPELTAHNARQIMEHKIVALAVLNRDNEDRLKTSISELKGAAGEWMDRQVKEFQLERQKLRDEKQTRIDQARSKGDSRGVRNAKAIRIDMESTSRQEVAFAWIDGVFWARWLRETYGIDVKDGERVLVTEEDRKKFWDSTASGNHIMVTRMSIIDTLDKVVYGPNPIPTKYTLSSFSKFFFDIKMTLIDRPLMSLGFIAVVGFGIYSWLRRSRRSRGGYLFPRDESMGLKDGLLGQPGNAKSD